MSANMNKRPVIYGEVLFDRFEDGSVVLGGAPFNVAWHLQAFGCEPIFISRVGDDTLGNKIMSAMQDWGMDTSGLQIDQQQPTGTVEVKIKNGEPSFDITQPVAYDFIDVHLIPEITSAELIYHGSLALRHERSKQSFIQLQNKLQLPAFIDVNLRSPWWHKSDVLELLQAAQWAKLNEHELEILIPEKSDLLSRAETLQHKAELQQLIITQGSKGAMLRTADGAIQHIEPELTNNIVDTVGAGDAFASIMIMGLLKQWSINDRLQRGQQFASAIVGQRGATVSDAGFYKPFIHNWG